MTTIIFYLDFIPNHRDKLNITFENGKKGRLEFFMNLPINLVTEKNYDEIMSHAYDQDFADNFDSKSNIVFTYDGEVLNLNKIYLQKLLRYINP